MNSCLHHTKNNQMRNFRQKEKKKLPQNKPSRDEPCLPRCNTSSMVGSADPRNMAALTQFISRAMRTFWPWLCCTCFLLFFSPQTVKINKSTMGGRSGHRRNITSGQARLVTARFVLRKLLFFWRKSLNNGQSWWFCALSKLVYFKTQLLELVESSMEVPISCC